MLNASILNSGLSSCINITSSNVTLDGAGYTIEGQNGTSSYGVNVNNLTMALKNVTVTNITVTKWDLGIYYNNAGYGNITNNNATPKPNWNLSRHWQQL